MSLLTIGPPSFKSLEEGFWFGLPGLMPNRTDPAVDSFWTSIYIVNFAWNVRVEGPSKRNSTSGGSSSSSYVTCTPAWDCNFRSYLPDAFRSSHPWRLASAESTWLTLEFTFWRADGFKRHFSTRIEKWSSRHSKLATPKRSCLAGQLGAWVVSNEELGLGEF